MDDLLAELTALETELHHPGATCTRTRLERLLHPDFHEIGRSGTRYTRQVVMNSLSTALRYRRWSRTTIASNGSRTTWRCCISLRLKRNPMARPAMRHDGCPCGDVRPSAGSFITIRARRRRPRAC